VGLRGNLTNGPRRDARALHNYRSRPSWCRAQPCPGVGGGRTLRVVTPAKGVGGVVVRYRRVGSAVGSWRAAFLVVVR
jgi:hypothetical protein